MNGTWRFRLFSKSTCLKQPHEQEKLTTAHNSLSALEQNRAELQTRATVGQEMSHATNKVTLGQKGERGGCN